MKEECVVFNTTKNIDITVRYKKIKEDIYVYEIKLVYDNIQLQDIIRLCYEGELTALCNDPIHFSKLQRRELDTYRVYKSSIKKDIRENYFEVNNNDYILNMKDILDEKVEVNKNDVLIKSNFYTDNFYEYKSKNPLPRSIHFDYCNGNLNNEHYDLDEVLKILENRTDVTIDNDKYNSPIQNIPYYNASDNKNLYISFTWKPTDEDWNKYVNSSSFGTLDRYEYILKNIFKL